LVGVEVLIYGAIALLAAGAYIISRL